MDWLKNHLGSLGYAGDFYIPSNSTGGGAGDGQKPHAAGEEQIKRPINYDKPRIVQTDEYDFPRIQKFFEWEQFLDYVDWSGHENRRASHNTYNKYIEGTLTRSFQEAMQLARYGWVDGLKQLKDIEPVNLHTATIAMQTYDTESRYDIAGGAVNIGRYLAHAPDCMRRMTPTRNHTLPARIQKILINSIFPRTTQPSAVLKHGYTVYQIIDALERANIQTDITIVFPVNKHIMYSQRDYYFYETYIKIKDSTDIIYPEKLLFCLAHPSMLRRLAFSEFEKNSRSVREFFHFYQYSADEHGYGSYVPEWQPPQYMMRDTLMIPDVSNANSMEHIIAQIQNMIKSQYEHGR